MAYHTHSTQGIVLGGIPVREGDKLLFLFTKEFGLVSAFARSVRTERSKMRGVLIDFTLGTVSLVRGKEYWRVVGMTRSASFYYALRTKPDELTVLINLAKLLRRLLPEEERNEHLYILMTTAFARLTGKGSLGEYLATLELLTSARALALLGHLPPGSFSDLMGDVSVSEDTLRQAKSVESSLREAVTHALYESGL